MSFVGKVSRFWLASMTAALLLPDAPAQQVPPEPQAPGAPPPVAPPTAATPAPTAPAEPAPPPAPPQLSRLSPLGQVPEWSRLEAFHKVLTREQFETAWKT